MAANLTTKLGQLVDVLTPDTTGKIGINMVPSNVLDITQTQNSASYVSILNSNASGAAAAVFSANNGTQTSQMIMFGTGYTTNGVLKANVSALFTGSSAGIALCTLAGPICFASNGTTEVARIDTSGNFLLATTSTPTSKLGVQGDAIFSNGGNVLNAGGAVNFSANGVNYAPMAMIKGLLSNTASLEDQGNLAFYTRPTGGAGQTLTERVRITQAGYVGIGTTSPATPLNISGSGAMIRLDGPSTTSSAYIAFTHAGSGVSAVGLDIAGGTLITSSPANSICIRNDMEAIVFSTGGSGLEKARLNSSGHLFVGTATDTGHVNVGGSVACFNGGTANVASNVMMDFSGGVGRIQGYGPDASTNGSLSFSSCRSDGSNPKTMTLDASGNLGLPGNITPAATTTVSVSTNSWSASTWYTLIAPGSLAQGAYWVSMRWDHTGGFPYIIAASFMVSVVNTNGTGADTQITLLTATHTGGGATGYVRGVAGAASTTGFEIQFTSIQAGTLTANFYKFS